MDRNPANAFTSSTSSVGWHDAAARQADPNYRRRVEENQKAVAEAVARMRGEPAPRD